MLGNRQRITVTKDIDACEPCSCLEWIWTAGQNSIKLLKGKKHSIITRWFWHSVHDVSSQEGFCPLHVCCSATQSFIITTGSSQTLGNISNISSFKTEDSTRAIWKGTVLLFPLWAASFSDIKSMLLPIWLALERKNTSYYPCNYKPGTCTGSAILCSQKPLSLSGPGLLQ